MKLVVCEDGSEYVERFQRFLGDEFEFVRASCFAEALTASEGATALLLDQDFRRTSAALLVDESGTRGTRSARELATVQGTLLLRALRKRGVGVPALLFADLDDPQRAATLERELSPLHVVASDEGMASIARRLRAIARGDQRP